MDYFWILFEHFIGIYLLDDYYQETWHVGRKEYNF